MDQTRREYNKKVLDRIASDPKFREELLDDPKGAMERANLKWEGDDDVTGYILAGPAPTGYSGGTGVGKVGGGGGLTAPPGGGGGTSGMVTANCDPGDPGLDPPVGGGKGVAQTPPSS